MKLLLIHFGSASYDNYEKLAKFEKIVAIGEIGLDYFHINLSKNVSEIKNRQKEVFWKQLVLALNLDLPVIIYNFLYNIWFHQYTIIS